MALFTNNGRQLQLIYYPHPTLRHRSKPLRRVDAELRRMVAEMFEVMYQSDGIGLAANQVNLPYRLFVMNVEADPAVKEAEMVFINPVIKRRKGQVEESEGCLSLPGIRAPVVRAEEIIVQAYNLAGEEVKFRASGLAARAVQHEVDHLDGILFIDRLSPELYEEIEPRLRELEREFQQKRSAGEIASDAEIAARLAELEAART
jgi:peptide deformylase